MLKSRPSVFPQIYGACALAFLVACNPFAAKAERQLPNNDAIIDVMPKDIVHSFSTWNDGGDYNDFLAIVDEYQSDIKEKLGRIPLFHAEIIEFFEHHDDLNLRQRFTSIYGRVQMSTNCYAFAVNDPFGHQPGKSPAPGIASGIISVNSGNGDAIAALAIKDGLIKAASHDERKEGYYRVALVIAEGEDFHWYREYKDGTWYHKMGHKQVTNKDASGNVITNPVYADRDYTDQGLNNYSTFHGYFHVPIGGVDLNTQASKKAVIVLKP